MGREGGREGEREEVGREGGKCERGRDGVMEEGHVSLLEKLQNGQYDVIDIAESRGLTLLSMM